VRRVVKVACRHFLHYSFHFSHGRYCYFLGVCLSEVEECHLVQWDLRVAQIVYTVQF